MTGWGVGPHCGARALPGTGEPWLASPSPGCEPEPSGDRTEEHP